jgi:DDE superfamily endonuclease
LWSQRERAESPLFPPVHPTDEQAREALLHVLHRDPHTFGVQRSRWTLAALGQRCCWLGVQAPASVFHVLERLGIHYKRARAYVHSPDPDYLSKLSYIRALVQAAMSDPSGCVLLFEDECSFYRHPGIAQAWEQQGHAQALAHMGHAANTRSRIAGALNALTGAVHTRQRSHLGVKELVAFYEQIAWAYPQAKVIYMVQDNWPVHFHPDVLAALVPQELAWPLKLTPYWSRQPSPQARRLNLPIRLVPLPTYASWCNPIEKLWRLLRQDLLHQHAFGDAWKPLKQAVNIFLDGLGERAKELLRYVGLADPTKLYASAFAQAEIGN